MNANAAHLLIAGGLPPQAFPLEPGTHIVGRAPEAAFSLPHVEVSRHHCRIVWDGESCAVEDLGSQRGTRVNGELISSQTLVQIGDTIAIGPVLMRLVAGEAPSLPAASIPEESGAFPAPVLVQGKLADRIPINGTLTLGRDPQADVVLHDPGVSRRHAQVQERPGGGCVITDLHSSAGSFVNGHRFDSHSLTIGDRVQIGPYFFLYDGRALVRVASTPGATLHAVNITVRAGTHTLLHGITLRLPASQFVGILGPSGAGKSTMLHALAGLRPPEGGRVLVNGEDLYQSGGSRSFGYVPQEDIVHPELTVSQALRFSARLRLPASTPPVEIQRLILQTMDQLGLRERSSHPICRLSGGQRKRVSVGVELLARPALLFLDEPSSGLDPATEFQLMELLRDLADGGCTIVCTTHVMENAYLMDRLVVLASGYLTFQGTAQQAREYFGVNKLAALYDRLQERPAEEWARDLEFTDAGAGTEAAPAEIGGTQNTAPSKLPRRAFMLPILLQRQWAILAADWRNFAILLGQPLVIGLLVSWVTDDRALILFFAYVATLWFGCSNAAQEIVRELPIYRRERLVGVSTHSYLVSKFLFLAAVTTLQAALFFGCTLLLERGVDGTVAWQIAGLAGTALAAVGIGSAISSLARSVMQAVLIVPVALIPQILFSGYTVPANEMKPTVFTVSRIMPTFAAQTVMDVSFLWQRKIARDTLSDHWTSFRNLNRDSSLRTGDVFNRAEPGWIALGTHAAWSVISYIVAWGALRFRERR